MAQFKMYVFVPAEGIKPTAKADEFDLEMEMGHNDPDPDKAVPTKVFVNNIPVRMVDVKAKTTETLTVKLDRFKPIKVRIERVGSKEGDEIEVPAEVETKASTKAEDKTPPDIEVVNPPRDLDPVSGLFVVHVVTRNKGVSLERSFTASSDRTLKIKQLDSAGNLVSVTTYAPFASGRYRLYIGFTGLMAKVTFTLDNGREAKVYLRK